jgi:hypothetical protein
VVPHGDWVWGGVLNLGALEAGEVADPSRAHYFALLCAFFLAFTGMKSMALADLKDN